MISNEYRELLTQKHQIDPDWGTSSPRYIRQIEKLVRLNGFRTLIDYGCGKGVLLELLKQVVPNLITIGYDPAIPKYATPPALATDMVVCTDVMEHVEEPFVADVLRDIKRHTGRLVFMVVACYPARHHLPDGRNAHITLKPPQWWKSEIEKVFPPPNMVYFEGDDRELEAIIYVNG